VTAAEALTELGAGAPQAVRPLPLDPHVPDRVGRLLENRSLLHELAAGLGSPLSLLLPQEVARRLAEFEAVRARHGLRGRVLFARKANRSQALLRLLAATAAGADVASLGELQDALAAGFTGDRVVAGGPKDRRYLWLAAGAGASILLDSPGELETLLELQDGGALPSPVSIGLRVSCFPSRGVQLLSRPSRFGIPAGEVERTLDRIAGQRHRLRLDLVGFHLDTTGVDERRNAVRGLLEVVAAARARGLEVGGIDVGGGWGARYLRDASQWQDYAAALRDAVLGRRPPLTWGNAAFGLRRQGTAVVGALRTHPWGEQRTGAAALGALLDEPLDQDGRPLAAAVAESLCDLHLEPGRALAAPAGVTLARVLEVRAAAGGEPLVRVAMNRQDLSMEDVEVFFDPVLVPAGGGVEERPPLAAYIVGNLCLEADFVSRHLVFFARGPRPGDLLAWPNTGGYLMDFSASQALQQPSARKVAVVEGGEGRWTWALDEEWWPA
jgi:diaminopimelate decarboxylase